MLRVECEVAWNSFSDNYSVAYKWLLNGFYNFMRSNRNRTSVTMDKIIFFSNSASKVMTKTRGYEQKHEVMSQSKDGYEPIERHNESWGKISSQFTIISQPNWCKTYPASSISFCSIKYNYKNRSIIIYHILSVIGEIASQKSFRIILHVLNNDYKNMIDLLILNRLKEVCFDYSLSYSKSLEKLLFSLY